MTKIKIAISGCLGRMGQELVKKSSNHKQINFVGGFDINNDKDFINKIFKTADVVIDFSSPQAIKNNLKLASLHKTGIVIGTTGLKQKELNLIKTTSKKIPILYSSNMSLGVNLLFNLVKQTASTLNDKDYDIEIAETHHKHKIDAPSGTALSLGEFAATGRKTNFEIR